MSWVAICSEDLTTVADVQASAMVYAFPKWAVYRVSGVLNVLNPFVSWRPARTPLMVARQGLPLP